MGRRVASSLSMSPCSRSGLISCVSELGPHAKVEKVVAPEIVEKEMIKGAPAEKVVGSEVIRLFFISFSYQASTAPLGV